MRITVEDILRQLASGLSIEELRKDFPELTRQDALTALEFAAEQQSRSIYFYLTKISLIE